MRDLDQIRADRRPLVYDSDGSRDDIILAKHLVRRGVRATDRKIP